MYKLFQKIYYKYFDISKKEYRKLYRYFDGCHTILDLGCGQGDFCINDRKRIIGVDINRTSLQKARKLGYRVSYGNALRLPFKKCSFDGVFCAHLIEHFDSKDALSLLKEIGRVLMPGGILLIQTPLLHKAFFNNFTHEKVYTPEAIMHYFSDTDNTTYNKVGTYEIRNLFYRYAPLYNPIIEPKRLPTSPYKSILILLKCVSTLLYFLGIKNYLCKDGYTLVLRKI